MSVTIEQYPQSNIMPVYNPITFTVDSTNKSSCQFRYVCDVYVNGTFVKRLKRVPNSTNGYATFDVSRVLEDYLSFDLNEDLYGSSLFATNANSCLDYVLKFGEEYDPSAQCDTGTTVYHNLTLSSSIATFSAFNGALQKDEWLLWDSSDYISTDVTSKFLTRFPERGLVTIGGQMVFNIFNSDIRKLQVKTYSSTGSLLGTYTYSNSYTSVTNATNRLLCVGVGPENLNNSTLASGTQPVINTSVAYYTVQLLKTADAVASELKRIDLDYRYSKWDHHRLWFLGRLGGMEGYTFTLRDEQTINTNRTEYKHLYGSYVDGSPYGTWTYNLYNRGRTTLSVNAQRTKTWTSNWLTEDEAIWMEELFTSPEVYEIIDNKLNCLRYFTAVTNDPIEGQLVVFTVPNDLEVGDTIRVMCSGYEALIGDFTIYNADSETITIESPFGIFEDGTYPDSIELLFMGQSGEIRPLIFKTSGYLQKVKNNIKNINYVIEVDDAEAVNTQRN
jgi:hypothetical protein